MTNFLTCIFDDITYFWRHDKVMTLWRIFNFTTNLLTSWRIFYIMMKFLTWWRTFWRHDVFLMSCCKLDLLTTLLTSWRTCWCNDVFLTSWGTFWCPSVYFNVTTNIVMSLHIFLHRDELFDITMNFWTSWCIFDVMTNFWTSWGTFWCQDVTLTSWPCSLPQIWKSIIIQYYMIIGYKVYFHLAAVAILAAILDFSNCSRISSWYPLDIHSGYPKDV